MSARSTTTSFTVVAWLAAGTWGCSGFQFGPDGQDTDTAGLETDTDTDLGGDTALLPKVWGIAGNLDLASGEIATETSQLTLGDAERHLLDPRHHRHRQPVDPVPASPPDLLQAWSLTVTPDVDASCAWPGPSVLTVALGPTEPRLSPAAARAGFDISRMYGLYLGQGGTDPFLVGLTGTQEMVDGTEAPTTDAAAPDGTYVLVTLHGIPLPHDPACASPRHHLHRRGAPASAARRTARRHVDRHGHRTRPGRRGCARGGRRRRGHRREPGRRALRQGPGGPHHHRVDDAGGRGAAKRPSRPPLGINVLRNDACAALSIASAVVAAFIRVNVLSGVMATDQGIIEGKARELLLLRQRLGAHDVGIAADVLVKHAAPLGTPDLPDAARDAFHRAGADALIVTGSGTGRPTSTTDLEQVRAAVPQAPLWLGSGLTAESAASVRHTLDGAIVGTWLHADGDLDKPLDVDRVRAMRAALS